MDEEDVWNQLEGFVYKSEQRSHEDRYHIITEAILLNTQARARFFVCER